MKRIFSIAFIFALSSCSRGLLDLPEDPGCIERVYIGPGDHSIKAADVVAVDALFNGNGIDHSRLRYYQYTHDSLQTLYPPFAKFDQKVIRADQCINGARLLTGAVVYSFLENKFDAGGDRLTAGTSLNEPSRLTLGQLRKLFVDAIDKFDHSHSSYKDSCFKAEFGYFNLNYGISSAPESLIQAWRITPKNTVFPGEYPVAFYRNDNGALISYNNGILTFH